MVAAAALLVASCAEEGDPSKAAQGLDDIGGSPRAPVQKMLRERADRLEAGDIEEYLAPMSPEARAFEEPIAREALKLPLSEIDITIGEATISLDGKRFTGAGITFRHRYRPLPEDNPFHLSLVYDLEIRDGSWIITNSRFPDKYLPPLWAIGPIEVTESPHFVVVARAGSKHVAEMTAKGEEGITRLLPKITLETDPKFLLFLPIDEADYEAVVGDSGSLAVASVNYVATSAHPLRPEDRHMIVNVVATRRAGARTIEEDTTPVDTTLVLQHELAHLALSRFTRPCTQHWVAEAAAMWLSDDRRINEWRRMVTPGPLDPPTIREMEQADVHYPTANAIGLALVEQKGAAKFLDFYQNFKDLEPSPDCRGRARRTERAFGSDQLLRRSYGIEVGQADELAKEYIRKAVAGE